ncbi:MAG TPA: hypothetical protein VMJ64_17855 [Anaerolineales bacterium]|nr:hypothetical protein [Anaerolineales bacterium]
MRIAEDSPQRLVLVDQGIVISLVCFAAAAIVLVMPLLNHGSSGDNRILAAFLALFGLLVFRRSSAEFDGVTQTCTVRFLRVLGSKRRSLSFGDIREVHVDTEPLTDQRDPKFRLTLETTSGLLPLTDFYNSDLQRHDAVRRAILAVLGREEAADPDPVHFLIRQGRTMDAVTLLRQRDKLDLTTARQRVSEMEDALKHP